MLHFFRRHILACVLLGTLSSNSAPCLGPLLRVKSSTQSTKMWETQHPTDSCSELELRQEGWASPPRLGREQGHQETPVCSAPRNVSEGPQKCGSADAWVACTHTMYCQSLHWHQGSKVSMKWLAVHCVCTGHSCIIIHIMAKTWCCLYTAYIENQMFLTQYEKVFS